MGSETLLETLYARAGRGCLLAGHLARLARSAAELGLPFDETDVRRAARAAAGAGTGRLRLLLNRRGVMAELSPLEHLKPLKLKLSRRGFGDPYDFRLKTRALMRRYAADRKSALRDGWDDLLYIDDEGLLLETTRMNLFAVLHGRLVTPPGPLLPGVGRALILRLFPVDVRSVAVEELARAEELFCASSLRGVVRVAGVAGLFRARGFNRTVGIARLFRRERAKRAEAH